MNKQREVTLGCAHCYTSGAVLVPRNDQSSMTLFDKAFTAGWRMSRGMWFCSENCARAHHAARGGEDAPAEEPRMTAHGIVNQAASEMEGRAKTYDNPEGERSMGATVRAFEAITGITLTPEQGWLFMATLKAVRSQQGAFRLDSYVDGAAYFGLAGEAAAEDRA